MDKKITFQLCIINRKPGWQRVCIVIRRNPFPCIFTQPQSQVRTTPSAEYCLFPIHPYAIYFRKYIIHLHGTAQSHRLQPIRSQPRTFFPEQTRLVTQYIILTFISQTIIPLMSNNTMLSRQQTRIYCSLVHSGLRI